MIARPGSRTAGQRQSRATTPTPRRPTGCARSISAPGTMPGPRSRQAAGSAHFTSTWTSRRPAAISSPNPSNCSSYSSARRTRRSPGLRAAADGSLAPVYGECEHQGRRGNPRAAAKDARAGRRFRAGRCGADPRSQRAQPRPFLEWPGSGLSYLDGVLERVLRHPTLAGSASAWRAGSARQLRRQQSDPCPGPAAWPLAASRRPGPPPARLRPRLSGKKGSLPNSIRRWRRNCKLVEPASSRRARAAARTTVILFMHTETGRSLPAISIQGVSKAYRLSRITVRRAGSSLLQRLAGRSRPFRPPASSTRSTTSPWRCAAASALDSSDATAAARAPS